VSKVLVFLAVSLPFVFAPCVFGQSVPAQAGTVKAGGQPIPGASVRATQGDRSLVTLTDDNGAFRFDGMSPGAWIVEADMFGFDHLRREVQVTAAPSNLDLTLQLSVRAAAPVRPPAQNSQTPDNLPASPPDAVAEFVPQVSADSSNESFLVNGTVSEALRTNQGDFAGAGQGGLASRVAIWAYSADQADPASTSPAELLVWAGAVDPTSVQVAAADEGAVGPPAAAASRAAAEVAAVVAGADRMGEAVAAVGRRARRLSGIVSSVPPTRSGLRCSSPRETPCLTRGRSRSMVRTKPRVRMPTTVTA